MKNLARSLREPMVIEINHRCRWSTKHWSAHIGTKETRNWEKLKGQTEGLGWGWGVPKVVQVQRMEILGELGLQVQGRQSLCSPSYQLCSLDTWFNFFKHQLLHLWNRGVILISILSWGFKDIMSWSAHHRTWYTGSTQNIGWDYDFQEAGYRWMAPPRHGKICVLELG